MRVSGAWRAGVSGSLAVVSALLASLTLLSADWVETSTGLNLDDGSGAVEAAVVVILLSLSVVVGGYSLRTARRLLLSSGSN